MVDAERPSSSSDPRLEPCANCSGRCGRASSAPGNTKKRSSSTLAGIAAFAGCSSSSPIDGEPAPVEAHPGRLFQGAAPWTRATPGIVWSERRSCQPERLERHLPPAAVLKSLLFRDFASSCCAGSACGCVAGAGYAPVDETASAWPLRNNSCPKARTAPRQAKPATS